MKTGLMLILLFAAAVLVSAAAGDARVTYIGHDKVAKGGTLVSAPDLIVMVVSRDKPGEVEIHDKETDTFHVLEGSATLVTGGTMTGGKVTAANQRRGKDITGGEVHHLTKGDVIVIPAGVPHWFKEVPQSINYYVVKVIKQ
jgi:quercetin dioxygenase-like cupin family protein